MQAKDLMSREPRTVRLHERLDAAARVMWEHDCGICPVVDSSGVLAGVVTDRDLCMAVYTQGRALGDIGVTAAMARSVRTVRAEDSLANVMLVMQQAQVHRVPVVDGRGVLQGIVSMNDLVRATASRPAAFDMGAVLKTLAAIGAPRAAVTAARVEPPRKAPAPSVVASAPAVQGAAAAVGPASAADADSAVANKKPGPAAKGKSSKPKASPAKPKGKKG